MDIIRNFINDKQISITLENGEGVNIHNVLSKAKEFNMQFEFNDVRAVVIDIMKKIKTGQI